MEHQGFSEKGIRWLHLRFCDQSKFVLREIFQLRCSSKLIGMPWLHKNTSGRQTDRIRNCGAPDSEENEDHTSPKGRLALDGAAAPPSDSGRGSNVSYNRNHAAYKAATSIIILHGRRFRRQIRVQDLTRLLSTPQAELL